MNFLLSIDGSTTGTGWAIINKDTLKLIDYGVFKKTKAEEIIMRNRVIYMIDGLNEIIEKYNPNEIVMEEVIPMINNAYTVLALGILSGGVLGIAHARNIPINYITVASWHTALNFYDGTTDGKKTDNMKQMSIEFANNKYNLNLIYKSKSSKFNSDNEADAVCIGCYYLGNYEKQNKAKFGRK